MYTTQESPRSYPFSLKEFQLNNPKRDATLWTWDPVWTEDHTAWEFQDCWRMRTTTGQTAIAHLLVMPNCLSSSRLPIYSISASNYWLAHQFGCHLDSGNVHVSPTS